MRTLARIILTSAFLVLGMAGVSSASSESVRIGFDAEPVEGPLFKEVARPVSANLEVAVDVPDGTQSVTPMIFSKVTFPVDMTFNPDPTITPVCPPEKVGPQTNLAVGVVRVVELCPDSVIGTGRAVINLVRAKASPLDDPELVVFNAGRDKDGYPKLTIYGFSRMVKTGLLMTGTMDKQNGLGISIGVLPFDSSIDHFNLGIPGPPMKALDGSAPGGVSMIQGRDPGYLRAKCSSGAWTATGDFVFATRDEATGSLTSPELAVSSPPFSSPCQGKAGKANLGRPFVEGPRTFKPGRSRIFRVKVSNSGMATARNVTVKVSGGGRGSGRVNRVGPLNSVRVPVRVKFSKSGKSKRVLRLTASGSGSVKSARIAVKKDG